MVMSLNNRRPLTEAISIEGALGFNRGDWYPDDFTLEPVEVQHIIELAGGFWRHDGNPEAPHAVLPLGKHSDGFIDLPAALKYVGVNDMFAVALANAIGDQFDDDDIHWVIGSGPAVATFSAAVASRLLETRPWIKHDFTEKVMLDGVEAQRWARHVIEPNESVLQIEDLCTSYLTLRRARKGIKRAHPGHPIKYLPVIGMAVNLTGKSAFNGSGVVPLLDITFNEWSPGECPLCLNGSEALYGVKKSAETWAKLTGRAA